MTPQPLPLGLSRAPGGEALARIERLAAYDFQIINDDLQWKYGWTSAKCRALELRTKQFMALSFLEDSAAHGPSAGVDEYWHRMILHTQWYGAFCSEVFDRFFHHNPTRPSAGDVEIGRQTRASLGHWFTETEKDPAPPQCNTTNCNTPPKCNTTNCNNPPQCNTTNCNTTNCNTTNCNNPPQCNTTNCNTTNCNNPPNCNTTNCNNPPPPPGAPARPGDARTSSPPTASSHPSARGSSRRDASK